MVIYIHGFGGSAEGVKARQTKEYFKEDSISISLSYVPELAIKTLEDLIKTLLKYEKIFLIGSSLGGYYAIYLAEKYNLKTVLLNPSIDPYTTLDFFHNLNMDRKYSDCLRFFLKKCRTSHS